MAATARAAAPTTRLSWEDIQSKAEASAKTSEVFVEEWGGNVLVRGLYLDEARDVLRRAQEESGGQEAVDPGTVACFTVAYGTVEPRIPPEQAMLLGRQSAGVVFKLFSIIDKLTGVSDAEVRRATEAFRDT